MQYAGNEDGNEPYINLKVNIVFWYIQSACTILYERNLDIHVNVEETTSDYIHFPKLKDGIFQCFMGMSRTLRCYVYDSDFKYTMVLCIFYAILTYGLHVSTTLYAYFFFLLAAYIFDLLKGLHFCGTGICAWQPFNFSGTS